MKWNGRTVDLLFLHTCFIFTVMKVSYATVTQEQFDQIKADHFLIPGRLYWVKDNGKIMRAESESSCTFYSNQIHVVDTYPPEGEEDHMYVNVNNGRAKVYHNGVYISVAGEGGGGSVIDLDELWRVLQNKADKSDLQWKSVANS